MSIVNPGGLPRYQDIDENTRKLCKEVILNKSGDGNHVERFLEFAERARNPPAAPVAAPALTIKKSSAIKQKKALRSLEVHVDCSAEHIQPEAGVGLGDVCRMEGTVETSKVADTIIACGTPHPDDMVKYFNGQLRERICFLDGGMGTRIQDVRLEEGDFRCERFKDFAAIDDNGVPIALKGNNDLLCFSKPQLIIDIHKEYYMAGSKICETITFNGTFISQGEYNTQFSCVRGEQSSRQALQENGC